MDNTLIQVTDSLIIGTEAIQTVSQVEITDANGNTVLNTAIAYAGNTVNVPDPDSKLWKFLANKIAIPFYTY